MNKNPNPNSVQGYSTINRISLEQGTHKTPTPIVIRFEKDHGGTKRTPTPPMVHKLQNKINKLMEKVETMKQKAGTKKPDALKEVLTSS